MDLDSTFEDANWLRLLDQRKSFKTRVQKSQRVHTPGAHGSTKWHWSKTTGQVEYGPMPTGLRKKAQVTRLKNVFLTNAKPWALITAYKDDRPLLENQALQQQLHKDLTANPRIRVYKATGFYTYPQTGVTSTEPSFFVEGLPEQEAIRLGQKYDQWEVITPQGFHGLKTGALHSLTSKHAFEGTSTPTLDRTEVSMKAKVLTLLVGKSDSPVETRKSLQGGYPPSPPSSNPSLIAAQIRLEEDIYP